MKMLLVLEHIFYVDENNTIWSKEIINDKYLERYLNVFDHVEICACVANKDIPIDERKKFRIKINSDNISILKLPYCDSSKKFFLNFFKMRKYFRNRINNFDCVILRGPSLLSLSLFDLCINKITFGVEFVMGANKILTDKNFLRKIMNCFLNIRAKKMCISANAVAYVTKEKLQEEYPSYSKIYGQDARHYETYYSSLDLYDNDFYNQSWTNSDIPSVFKIIHIGSMQNDRKGQERLLNIIKIVKDDGYNIDVKFLGDGKLLNYLKKKTEELNLNNNVTFTGNINDKKQVFKYLRESHLFVLPTSSEGLPRSIIEAMASGLPCLSSPVDGVPELLDNDCLIKYDDLYEYAKKIEYLLSNWNTMIKISNQNYHEACKYRYEILSARRKQFYQKILEISTL